LSGVEIQTVHVSTSLDKTEFSEPIAQQVKINLINQKLMTHSMKIFTTVLSFAIIILVFASCKKEDDTDDPPVPPVDSVLTGDSILYRIVKNSVIVAEYVYNNDHTVKTITCYDDAGSYSYSSTSTYNPAAKVVRIDYAYSISSYNSYDTCYYNSDNRISVIYNYWGGVEQNRHTMQYDIAGRLIHLYFLYSGSMFGTNYIYGNNTNVLKEYDSGDLLCDTTYYVYDDKKSFKIKGFTGMMADDLSANNIVQRMHNDQSGNPKPSDSYNSVFEYNANGLPTKETRTYLNSTVVVYEFIYY
jgi:hypothetical protein